MVRPLEYYSCELGLQGPTRVSEKSFSFGSHFPFHVLGGVAVRSSSALDMNHDQARLFPAQVQSASSEKCCPHSLFSFLFVCPRLAGPFQALVNGRLAASGLRASGLRPGPPRSSAHAFFHLSPWTQSIAQSAIRQQNPELAFFAPNRRRHLFPRAEKKLRHRLSLCLLSSSCTHHKNERATERADMHVPETVII